MKLFHLADLHLGKSLYERDLIEDQRHALAAVLEAVAAERPACVVIAGDVFDRSVPPAEAVTLLGEFVASVRAATRDEASDGAVVAMIPGNHDSAARLAFLAPVLASAGVYVASDPSACDVPVVVESGGEAARLWLLPFLTPGAFGRPEPGPAAAVADAQGDLFSDEPAPVLRSQADMFAEAMRRVGAAMEKARAAGAPAADVLVCHAFAAGGQPSDSERAFIGTAELVDGSAFEAFDYVALGHLHRPQSVGSRGRYPGSLLAYSFSETGSERGFLSVDLRPGSAVAAFRPVSPLRRMIRVEGRFDEVLADASLDAYAGDYIEAVLDDAAAVLNPMDALRRRFPFILSLRQAAFERSGETERPGYAADRTTVSVADDFAAFYREMLEREPDPDEAALFAELYEEASREAP